MSLSRRSLLRRSFAFGSLPALTATAGCLGGRVGDVSGEVASNETAVTVTEHQSWASGTLFRYRGALTVRGSLTNETSDGIDTPTVTAAFYGAGEEPIDEQEAQIRFPSGEVAPGETVGEQLDAGQTVEFVVSFEPPDGSLSRYEIRVL